MTLEMRQAAIMLKREAQLRFVSLMGLRDERERRAFAEWRKIVFLEDIKECDPFHGH